MNDDSRTHTDATPARHIGAVNAKLAIACILAGMAYLLWPDSAFWWTFYPLSILCGVAALAMIVQAVNQIRQIRNFERDQRDFEEQGRPVKTAALAREDFLTEKGVIRDDK